ncbi:MAG: heme o synthase [candidate division Zixibacteria bacterium]|nr:heme o synthase [candidate division Zixibacteria bacterium]
MKPRFLDFIQLTKPTILLLVVLTGAAALVMEESLLSDPLRFALVILGLALTGGAANGLNQYFERDIDAVMERTRKKRPLPLGNLPPRAALIFACSLGVAAVLLFAGVFNLFSAVLALGTIIYYAFFYTLYLKPRMYQNIVIGGAAGSMAPVIAWAAATGGLNLTPWILFLIIFFWTPPHFWALAMCVKKDYEKAKIPMLPVVKGDKETARQILFYTLWMAAFSLALLFVRAGLVYLLLALILNGIFLYKAYRIWRRGAFAEAWGLFGYSIVYLLALFLGIMADAVWHKSL